MCYAISKNQTSFNFDTYKNRFLEDDPFEEKACAQIYNALVLKYYNVQGVAKEAAEKKNKADTKKRGAVKPKDENSKKLLKLQTPIRNLKSR